MQNQFVKFTLDLHCHWSRRPPNYRLYVNHELFAERTYVWNNTQYLQEIIQLNAPPGRYLIRVDNLGDPECEFKIRNLNVEIGPAQIIDHKTVEILNAGS
jgi:hypothetical protein